MRDEKAMRILKLSMTERKQHARSLAQSGQTGQEYRKTMAECAALEQALGWGKRIIK